MSCACCIYIEELGQSTRHVTQHMCFSRGRDSNLQLGKGLECRTHRDLLIPGGRQQPVAILVPAHLQGKCC